MIFDALTRWEAFASVNGLAESTIANYGYWLLRVMWATKCDLDALSEDEVVAYLATLPPKGHSRGAALRALHSYFRWAEAETGRSPVRRLRIRRQKYGPAASLTPEELHRLVEAAKAREPRRGWTILFDYSTGLRLASLCAVTVEDVHTDYVEVRKAKGDRPYVVPLGPTGRQAADELIAWPGIRARPTLVGVGPGQVWNWVNQAAKDTGLRAHPHLLRHTFATQVYEATKDPEVVARLLNHADLSQVHRYIAPSDERKRKAVELL